MNNQNRHATLAGTAQGVDNSRYLVSSRTAIQRILRGLAKRNELVSAFFNGGQDILLTLILEVLPEKNLVLLDLGANEDINRRILSSERIVFVTALDKVKIQFVSGGIAHARFDGRAAFSIAFPEEVLELQRRDYYRVTTPLSKPLKCLIPDINGTPMEVMVVDISAGGVGIMLHQSSGIQLRKGMLFKGCRIALPGEGTVEATLNIQSSFMATLKNGHKAMRSGCQFVNLNGAMQAMIQRYIVKLERERIAHTPKE